jgi:hypothetical protein
MGVITKAQAPAGRGAGLNGAGNNSGGDGDDGGGGDYKKVVPTRAVQVLVGVERNSRDDAADDTARPLVFRQRDAERYPWRRDATWARRREMGFADRPRRPRPAPDSCSRTQVSIEALPIVRAGKGMPRHELRPRRGAGWL